MTLKQEVLQKLIDAWPDGITNHDFPAGTSLTQRIADLKSKDGKNIETVRIPHITKHGKKGSHALYKQLQRISHPPFLIKADHTFELVNQ